MSILSSIFGGGGQQPTPGNMPAQPTMTTAVSDGTAPNGAVPAGSAEPPPASSPLDQFKDIWEPVSQAASESAFTKLDPSKVREAVNKADFSKALSQENLARIAQGGDEAIGAFTESLNNVAQQVLTQATLISNSLIEQQVSKALQQEQAKLPQMLKKQSVSETLASNPLFKNPAVRPVIEAVQHQLTAKYPNASAQEIAQMATNFVTVMGESFAPKPASKAPQEPDWESFLSS